MQSYETIRLRAVQHERSGGSGVSAFVTGGMYAWINLVVEMPESSSTDSPDFGCDEKNKLPGAIQDEMVQLLVSLLMNRTKEVAHVC